MYWRSHLSLQTADVPVNQNWFELRWMITGCCRTTSWKPIGRVFRVNFLCSHSLLLALSLLLSPPQSHLHLPLPHSSHLVSLSSHWGKWELSPVHPQRPRWVLSSRWPLLEFQRTAEQGWVSGEGGKTMLWSVSLKPFLSLILSSQGCFL